MQKFIHIEDARVHNLKNLTVDIPRGLFTVITGVSGSGKSSLAFDTLFVEGQRQYLETLSIRSRHFLQKIKAPDVQRIQGLPPTVAVDQRSRRRNSQSTVATLTEIDDYLRLLYARCGTAHCFQCGQPIQRQSSQRILQELMKLPSGTRLMLLAPLVRGKKGEHTALFQKILKDGFVRTRTDGILQDVDPPPKLAADQRHDIEAVIDRIVIKDGVENRLAESLQLALKHGEGTIIAVYEKARTNAEDGTTQILWQDVPYSTLYACPSCNISYLELEPRTFNFNSPYGACIRCEGTGTVDAEKCPECQGTRLRQEARNVLFGGRKIYELYSQSVKELCNFFQNVEIESEKQDVAAAILEQINNRLQFMIKNGLDYLTLDRPADTLSGGEYQRVRLANSLGNALTGVCYVLDEPTAGLHPRDNQRLLEVLRMLQQQGNTVIAVEHDETFIRQADYLIDLGPGAGKHGGEIVYQDFLRKPFDAKDAPASLTLQYLTGQRSIPVPKTRRKIDPARMLTLHHCTQNNLKDITVSFPLGTLICVTGVSGSGKSSLITDTLIPALQAEDQSLLRNCSVSGTEQIDKVIGIDQLLPGQSLRSSPATYSGVFDEIRKLFALTREAKQRGYTAHRFSFNYNAKQGGGRCEVCQGTGTQKIEWDFLYEGDAVCPACNGKRFNRQTLEVRYRGKAIADVLEMSMDDAVIFFENIPKIERVLRCMVQAGLGYVGLGQSASTLSGGELQRLKLATELSRPSSERGANATLYVLDEPTTGLHFYDVHRLVDMFHRLVDSGNTVIIVEHHLDVIKSSDYIIDLGPEGGVGGGYLTASGTPEEPPS